MNNHDMRMFRDKRPVCRPEGGWPGTFVPVQLVGWVWALLTNGMSPLTGIPHLMPSNMVEYVGTPWAVPWAIETGGRE